MSHFDRWQIVPLQTNNEKEGLMVIAEVRKLSDGHMPYVPRSYWIRNTTKKSIARGGHFHQYGSHLEVLVPMVGEMEIELHAKYGCSTVKLSGNQAIFIPYLTWHRVTIPAGGILLSFAGTEYTPGEWIPDLPCKCHLPGFKNISV